MNCSRTESAQPILDAISDQIVVIGEYGRILETNKAWDLRIGTPQAAMEANPGGHCYWEICQESKRAFDPDEMRFLEEGVCEVLKGARSHFVTEYRRADSWGGDRWFSLRATALPEGRALLVHKDISAQKLLDHEFRSIGAYERRQIGTELHDGLCQILSGMVLSTAVVSASLHREESPHAQALAKILEMAKAAVLQAKDLTTKLQPLDLDATDLATALQQLAASANDKTPCNFIGPSRMPPLQNHTALGLYRIAQEAISNAILHACAEHIEVKLIMRKHFLVLTIQDHSPSSPNLPLNPAGMGIQLMRHRACALGARLRVQRNRKGTLVRCLLRAQTV